MSPKVKSIQVHQADDPPTRWLIKGNTSAIKQALIDGGATWDGQRVCWQYVGRELPAVIWQTIADVLGEGGPLVEVPPPARVPRGGQPQVPALAAAEQLPIEPDGTDTLYAIEARYGLGQGQDWFTVYQEGRAVKPEQADSALKPYNTYYVSESPAKPVPSLFNAEPRVTPVRKQYLDLKAQHADHILFFRLGDFYEAFDDDARTVADVCDVVLTGRPINKNTRVPMAGVPFHALEPYLEKLLAAGHTVAVAEQTGQPVSGSGVVERTVTRVLRPGVVKPEPPAPEPVPSVAWERRDIRIKNRSSQAIPVAADVYGQVALHPELVHGGTFSETRLTLTHILSGMVILTGAYTRQELQPLAEMLAELDIDQWWRNVEQGTADRTDQQIIAVIDQRWGRRKPSGSPVPTDSTEVISS